MSDKKIKIYSTPTCPYCKMAKHLFDSLKVAYTEVDVSVDEEAAHEMIHKTGQVGVPVIEIGETIILGFDRPTVLKVMEEAGIIRKKEKKPQAAAAGGGGSANH
ncbi:MAG: glutaredoxin family protein [Candidatus Geothermincolia bacterium]